MCVTPKSYIARLGISRREGELYTPCIFAELSRKSEGPVSLLGDRFGSAMYTIPSVVPWKADRAKGVH